MLMDPFREAFMKSVADFDKNVMRKDVDESTAKLRAIGIESVLTDEYGIKYTLRTIPIGIIGRTATNVQYARNALPLSMQDMDSLRASGIDNIKEKYSSLYAEIMKSDLRKTEPELFYAGGAAYSR